MKIKNMFKNKNILKNKTLITNFIIVFMLALIGIQTFDFASQTVFGNNEKQAIYYGNKNSSNVSLMVNVYWGTEFLNPMLEVFEEYGVKTTFFVGGSWAEKEDKILRTISDAGHEIGNHGYFHKNHNTLNYEQNFTEINVTHKVVQKIIGVDMKLFAPPSGAFNKTTLNVASDLGYKTIMWSKDTIDWRDKDENVIYTRATKNVVGGDLILMHPTEHTLKALPKILEFYKNNNLKAVTVSDAIKA